MAMLIVLGGLPGTGKTAIAREIARVLNAVYVRIDSIEQAIRTSGVLGRPIDDTGYVSRRSSRRITCAWGEMLSQIASIRFR
jgi:predicted kinase